MQNARSAARIRDLHEGTAMVVTDLHGDYAAYARYRDGFLQLRAAGRADTLIFCGDLIHTERADEADGSLDIVKDVLALEERLGDHLIYLLGNHELPHLYGFALARGDREYTPSFEQALGDDRSRILALFERLPFFVRTAGGVAICHAGAAAELAEADALRRLLVLSHSAVRAEGDVFLNQHSRETLRAGLARLNGRSYDHMVQEYLAVADRDDPRYDDLLRGAFLPIASPDYPILYAALFTRNEQEYGKRYPDIVTRLLSNLSQGYADQRVLVSGHLMCRNGYTVVNERHVRIASGVHARPRESARYLLLDCEKRIESADELLAGLQRLPSEDARRRDVQ